jgi:hypothetical protein
MHAGMLARPHTHSATRREKEGTTSQRRDRRDRRGKKRVRRKASGLGQKAVGKKEKEKRASGLATLQSDRQAPRRGVMWDMWVMPDGRHS